MASASITVHMDRDLKNSAEALFRNLGLNMTTAFTIFARQAVRQQKIPFELSANNDDFVYGGGNAAYLKRGLDAYKAGQFAEHDLIEV
jgi:DNA-damage-inducible protein J